MFYKFKVLFVCRGLRVFSSAGGNAGNIFSQSEKILNLPLAGASGSQRQDPSAANAPAPKKATPKEISFRLPARKIQGVFR